MVSQATLVSWTGEKPLGGVVCLSGFQVLNVDYSKTNMAAVRKTPFFRYHGTADKMMPLVNSETTFEYLQQQIYVGEHLKNYQFYTEEGGGHYMTKTATKMVKSWLAERFLEIDQKVLEKSEIRHSERSRVEFVQNGGFLKFYGNLDHGSREKAKSRNFKEPLDLSEFDGLSLTIRPKVA